MSPLTLLGRTFPRWWDTAASNYACI